MSFLWVTIPVSMMIAVILLALVVHGVRTGVFDDWEGPAWRLHHDEDEIPEIPDVKSAEEEALPAEPGTRR